MTNHLLSSRHLPPQLIHAADPDDIEFVGKVDVLWHCGPAKLADFFDRFAARRLLRTELEQAIDVFLAGDRR